MEDVKEKYAENLKSLARVFLHDIKDKNMPVKDSYLLIMGATQHDVSICFDKITHAIPDVFFYKRSAHVRENIKEDIVKEFVLFMAQEDITAESFDNDFSNFISFTIAELGHKYKMF